MLPVPRDEQLVVEINTAFGLYQVVDMIYDGRPARVLFSGDRVAAQSGIARDDKPDLLFDYNQRFIELVSSLRPKCLLLIGGGAFTLPMALRAHFPQLKITVVEINPDLPELAKHYFGFESDENMQIVIGDGRSFLETNRELYDVILLDAFSNASMPRELMTAEAGQAYARHLAPGGVLAANIIAAYYGQKSAAIYRLWSAFASAVKHVEAVPASRSLMSFWTPQNFVLIGYNGIRPVMELRYAPIEPLPAGIDTLAHDT